MIKIRAPWVRLVNVFICSFVTFLSRRDRASAARPGRARPRRVTTVSRTTTSLVNGPHVDVPPGLANACSHYALIGT
jgi:hypothetical protein